MRSVAAEILSDFPEEVCSWRPTVDIDQGKVDTVLFGELPYGFPQLIVGGKEVKRGKLFSGELVGIIQYCAHEPFFVGFTVKVNQSASSCLLSRPRLHSAAASMRDMVFLSA